MTETAAAGRGWVSAHVARPDPAAAEVPAAARPPVAPSAAIAALMVVQAALDLALIVPALTAGGTLLWRRRAWGYVIAAAAGVQGSLYLLVLSVNSAVAVARGLAAAPGELPVWGTLAVTTAAATYLLLAGAGRRRQGG